MGGIDDAIEEMRRGDLEGATMMSPIDYAKLRGIYPQKVYAALRGGRLEEARCGCGRKVVVVDDADKLFGLGEYREATKRSEALEGGEATEGEAEV